MIMTKQEPEIRIGVHRSRLGLDPSGDLIVTCCGHVAVISGDTVDETEAMLDDWTEEHQRGYR